MVWPLSRVKYRMERGSIPVNLCNWAKRQKHGTSKIASVLAGQTKQLFEIWPAAPTLRVVISKTGTVRPKSMRFS